MLFLHQRVVLEWFVHAAAVYEFSGTNVGIFFLDLIHKVILRRDLHHRDTLLPLLALNRLHELPDHHFAVTEVVLFHLILMGFPTNFSFTQGFTLVYFKF
jgi:hypothetical protein